MLSATGPRSPSCASPIPERSRNILASLVHEYIERGEPISSLWLAQHVSFRVSSATVRQHLAKLEEAGYVRRPHTSAGRIPTDLGYRCYVDLLLQNRRRIRSSRAVEARLSGAHTVEDVLSNVSQELSRASKHMGFALAPANEAATFKNIDFVPLEGTKILVVLVATGGQISRKVVDLGEPLQPTDLVQATNYLNTQFSGLPLREVRTSIEERLNQDRVLYDALLSRALHLANSTFEDISPSNTLFTQGASLLLDDESSGDDRLSLATLRALFTMIEEKHRLIRLLSHSLEGLGLTIVIGTEHTTEDLQDLSLIASTYFDGQQIGSVGVIGPRRMRYSSNIVAVASVSHAVSRVLIRHGSPKPIEHGRRNTVGTA